MTVHPHGFTYLFAGLPVQSRDASQRWYERLLGRVPDFLPNEMEAVWQVAPTGSIYIIEDPQRAGHGETTLVTDDLDRLCKVVRGRGIETEPIIEIPGAGRKAKVFDPDANLIAFVQLTT